MSARIDKQLIAARGFPPGHQDRFALQLADTGDQRLASMDEAGITFQILSVAGPGADLLPVGESISFAMDYNDALARIIETNPDRFGGFAHLPMADAEAAAMELQRTSTIPGFCGAMINGMTDNLFLVDDRFSALLATAQRRSVTGGGRGGVDCAWKYGKIDKVGLFILKIFYMIIVNMKIFLLLRLAKISSPLSSHIS